MHLFISFDRGIPGVQGTMSPLGRKLLRGGLILGIHVATQLPGLRGSQNGPFQPVAWMCSHCGLGVIGHCSTHHLAWVAFPRIWLHCWVRLGTPVSRRAVGQQKKHAHSLPYLARAESMLCPLYPRPAPLSWWLGQRSCPAHFC